MVPSVGSTLSVKCLKCYYAQEVDQLFPVSPEDKINKLKAYEEAGGECRGG